MQQNGGDFKELDVLQAKANREYRKNFHEAKQKYYNDNKNININNNNKDTIAQLKGQYNEMVDLFDNELQPSNYSSKINNNNNNNNKNHQINDNQKNTRIKNINKRKQNRNQISNTLSISNSIDNKNIDNKNIDNNNNNKNKGIKFPQNPYNFTKTIPSSLINNLKDIAQNYYEIKCAEAKNNHDRSKLQTNLRIFEDEYHRKMNYLRSIPVRYAQDVQKLRKELPKGNKQIDALNLLIDTYTQEIDNAKLIAGNSMPSRTPSDRYTVVQYQKSSSSSVSNEYNTSPYEISTVIPTKLPMTKHQQQHQQLLNNNNQQLQTYKKNDVKNKKFERVTNNQQQQQQQQNQQHQLNYHQARQPKSNNNNNNNNNNQNNNNNNQNISRRSLSRFSTGKFATSKSKLTNIIARLRLRARDEFKAKVNAVRDTTRRESDFANHMKLLRDEYYSAIQRINKIPTMNKEFGLKYVQSLQKAQRSLKGKDPELDDLLDYLRKEHQIQN